MTKEALKLALEALDHLITEFRIHDLPYGSKAYTKGTNAIREIQAVLAQPEQKLITVVDIEKIVKFKERNA